MQFVVAVCHDEKSLPSLSSELILFNVHVEARGEWECVVSTGRGNTSRSVEILVLENSASFCPEDKVVNNRGEFRLVTAAMIFIVQLMIRRSHSPLALIPRWPRTLAGITSHQYCLQLRYPSLSVEGGIEQKKASRQCDSYGKWKEGDYSDCHYTNGITRVLHTFILVSTAVREKRFTPTYGSCSADLLLCFRSCLTEAHQCVQCCHPGTSGAHVHPGGCRLHRLCGCVVCGTTDGEVCGICQTAAGGEQD